MSAIEGAGEVAGPSRGTNADCFHAEALIEAAAPKGTKAEVVIADEGYDCEAVVPSITTRKQQRQIDAARYADINAVERFWS